MKIDLLLRIAWLIANAEAKNLGAIEIQPIHFLLAAMKIIDPAFPGQLDNLEIGTEEWASMCKEAQGIRRYIDVLPDRVTLKRRTLRRRLAEKQVVPPVTQQGMLHRSEKSRKAFADAAMFSEGEVLTLRQFIESLFELEMVTLADVDSK